MSVDDDVLSFEQQLRRLVEEAIGAAEKNEPGAGASAFVLGYVIAGASFSREERKAIFDRLRKQEGG